MKQVAPRRRRCRHRVRFADEGNGISDSRTYSFNSHRPNSAPLCSYSETSQPKVLSLSRSLRLWFQPDDFLQFRVQSRVATNSALNEGWNVRIANWHRCANSRDKDDKVDLDSLDVQNAQMRKWASRDNSPSCRGLERFVSIDYARYRLALRRRQVQAVKYAQEQLKIDGEVNSISRAWDILAKVAASFSHNSVSIAVRMAKADATAVAADLECSSYKRILTHIKAPITPVRVKRKLQPVPPKTPTSSSPRVRIALSPLSSSYVPPSPLNVPMTPKKEETLSPSKKLSPFISPTPLHFTTNTQSRNCATKNAVNGLRTKLPLFKQ